MPTLNYTLHPSDAKTPATMMLLHGFMGRESDWAAVVPALVPHFQVLTVDLPGHGASLLSNDVGYGMDDAASYLIELLDHLQIEQAHVVGYSMGGRVALYLAVTYPQRVAKLVLESSSPGLREVDARAQRQQWDNQVAERLVSQPLPQFLAEWYKMALFDSLKHHPNFEAMLAARQSNNAAHLARSMREMGTGSQPSLWDAWVLLKNESLLIVGELDEKYVGVSAEMHTLRPQTQTITLPAVGHNAHFENPVLFTTTLLNFLLNTN